MCFIPSFGYHSDICFSGQLPWFMIYVNIETLHDLVNQQLQQDSLVAFVCFCHIFQKFSRLEIPSIIQKVFFRQPSDCWCSIFRNSIKKSSLDPQNSRFNIKTQHVAQGLIWKVLVFTMFHPMFPKNVGVALRCCSTASLRLWIRHRVARTPRRFPPRTWVEMINDGLVHPIVL